MNYFVSLEFYLLLIPLLFLMKLFCKKQSLVDASLVAINFVFIYLLLNQSLAALLLIFFLTVLVWWISKFLASHTNQSLLVGAVVTVLAVLAFSKYSFFYESQWAGWISFKFKELFHIKQMALLGVGVSYFSFKMIHYLNECSLKNISNSSLLRFLNYILFFPTFISGPMDRFERFSADIDNYSSHKLNSDILIHSLFRIFLGLFKKIVLVSILAGYTLDQSNASAFVDLDFIDVAVGAYAYAFMLYLDFSGYSDMAIGVSRLFGITTPENFNSPFLATSIQDFWNRWHITLSTWIRDYIFSPLFKSFMLKAPKVAPTLLSSVAIFIAFVLCGVWHGDGLNYTIWGALNGLALSSQILYKAWIKANAKQWYKLHKKDSWYKMACWAVTFHFVVFSLLIFSMDASKLKALLLSQF